MSCSVISAQSPSLPEHISKRIGAELDPLEAEYFGMFSWVKGFKKGIISTNNGELTFRIERQSEPDTIFTFSQKNSQSLEKYVSTYEEIFTKQEVEKAIDWDSIATYLRPSNPIRKPGEVKIELNDNTNLQRQLIWAGDSSIAVWKDDSPVDLGRLTSHTEVYNFNEVKYINNQPVSGNITAFANNITKIKTLSYFSRISPELRDILQQKVSPGITIPNANNEVTNPKPTYETVKEEYFKRFTVGLLYYPIHLMDKESYKVTNTIYRYGSSSGEINTETGAEHNMRKWGAEVLYNINPSISLGLSYTIPSAEYEATRPLTNEPVLLNDPYNRDVASETTTALLFRYHPKPRDPILTSLEAELGLSVGYESYSIHQTRYYAGTNLERTTKGSAIEGSAQLGCSYFIFQNLSMQGGVLYRISTQIKIPDSEFYSQSYLLIKVNTNEIRTNEISFFLALRFHI
ncbi:MAG: hypothetical protein V4642_11575 [Bacteroidota bacterium]